MSSVQEQLDRLRREIPEISPEEFAATDDHALVDVREQAEWSDGHVEGAILLSRGYLDLRIEQACPNQARPVVLYCQTGTRSLLAAKTLKDLGYERVLSLAGEILLEVNGRVVLVTDGC